MSNSNKHDDWAKIYDIYETKYRNVYKTDAFHQNDMHSTTLEHFFKKKLFTSESFCEIGFGAGITLRRMSKIFKKVYGIDISLENVLTTQAELKSEGFTNIELFHQDILKFDQRFINKFNVITYIHGLEHFSEKDYPEFFSNIRQYLIDDGFFTGALPFELPLRFRICPNCGNEFEIDGHLSVHSIESIKKLLETNKFKIIYLSNFNKFQYIKNKGIVKYYIRESLGKIIPKLSLYSLRDQIEFVAQKI